MNRKKAEAQCGKQSKMAKVTNVTDGVRVKLRLRFRTFRVQWAPSPQLNAEPWRRRSAWARSSQHWSAWLNSSSGSWSQWQGPLTKIPAVPAGQTAGERRLMLPFLASQEPLIWGSYNKMVYFSHLALLTHRSASQCFLEHCASWRAKKSKKDGAANIAKKN